MNRLNKTESGVFMYYVISLLPKDLLLFIYFASLQLVSSECVAVAEGRPVLHHSAAFILWSFGINELIVVCFEYTVLLKYTLEGVSSVAFIITAHEQTQ